MPAILYLYFFSTFLPFGHRAVAAERAELEQEYRQLSSDLSKARQTLNNLAEIERQYEVLNRRWEVAANLLPEEREVAELLRKVTLVGSPVRAWSSCSSSPSRRCPGEVYNENPVDVRVVGRLSPGRGIPGRGGQPGPHRQREQPEARPPTTMRPARPVRRWRRGSPPPPTR